MISLHIVSLVLISHLFADFFLQSRNQVRKKSTNILFLLTHVLIYSSMTTFFWWLIDLNYDIKNILNYILIFLYIFIAHGLTDYVTSKLSRLAYLKTKNENEKVNDLWEWVFWLIIGLDQTIHIISLFWIYLMFN